QTIQTSFCDFISFPPYLICYECEKDMVNTETNDPKYIYYLKQLRKLEVSYF
ncbi:sigma factor G inhibitor Gin, partial [Bacillus sp. D-CC]